MNINDFKSQALARVSHGEGSRLIAQLSEKAANLAMERPGVTKEAAFTQLLIQNPQAYAAYKADHDAESALAASGMCTPAEVLGRRQ